jgi:hypothetical protein
VFDPGQVTRVRPGPDHNRLIVARLTAIAQRHALWRELTEAETTAAVAELRETANGRDDLLGEVAGVMLGAHEGELDEPRAKAAAHLCVTAGADEALISEWIAEGRRRAASARLPPFSAPSPNSASYRHAGPL